MCGGDAALCQITLTTCYYFITKVKLDYQQYKSGCTTHGPRGTHNPQKAGMWPTGPTKNMTILARNLFTVAFLHKHGYECNIFAAASVKYR